MERVYDVPEVRKYLPDYDETPEKYMSRDFLFAIVNKIDSTFFPRIAAEITAKIKPKDKPTSETTIKV